MKTFLKILKIAFWAIVIGGAATLMGFVEVVHYGRTCQGIDIHIDYGAADVLITKKDADSIILHTAGWLRGKSLGRINTAVIEEALRRNPYVAEVKVFENNKGTIFVKIKQKEPILRIINDRFENFYLDESGTILPTNPGFSARVLVATGHIPDSYIKNPGFKVNMLAVSDSLYYDSLMTNLYKLTMYIVHDPFFRAHLDQIYVNELGEFELIPRIGNQVILFGKAEDLEAKFRKLLAFYKYGLNKVGWNKYTHINIKYKNQVLCSKR